MGNSAPPPARFELVNSYARRRGATVEIVLTRPDLPAPESWTRAVLRNRRDRAEGRVELRDGPLGRQMVVTVARDELTDGTWRLRLRGPDAEPVGTSTRLLVQGERPLVLLWGGDDPDSRIPTPRADPSSAATSLRGVVVRRGSRALDLALSPLPEEHRRRTRQRARRVARRLLG